MNYFRYAVIAIFSLILSFSSFAKDLKIEQDPIFKVLLEEFKTPGSHLNIYQESENYRFDLTLYDVVDTVSIILEESQFSDHKEILNDSYRDDPIYFYQWFLKLKEIADKDTDFYERLNRKLYVQLYNKNGLALLPEYKYIDFDKIKDLKLLNKLKRYNEIINSPEGKGLSAAYSQIQFAPFITEKLTVTKLNLISRKKSEKIQRTYYKVYTTLIQKQYLSETKNSNHHFSNVIFTPRKNRVKASSSGTNYHPKAIRVFNLIQELNNKQGLLQFLKNKLLESKIHLPSIQGHLVMTPYFIKKHWVLIKEKMNKFTYNELINVQDDEYLLVVRKWIKRNKKRIITDLTNYNLENGTTLTLEFRKKRLPRRISVLKHYQTLEKIYPNRPWITSDNADLIDSHGRARYFDDKFIKKIGRKFLNVFKYLIKVENYVGLITGTAVLIASGGNVALSMSTQALVKKAIYNLRHDKEWKEFIRSAPIDVLSAFLLGSGFTAGRLYHILAMGSAQGALQSLLTGQDVRTGAFVGAGLNLMRYYLLPYNIARPMTSGFDGGSLATNRLYEIIGTTVNSSLQGAIVAGFTGENPLSGALRGGIYGTISSALTIWILGTRYHPFKDYTDEELDSMIAAENNFQNDVGRGGVYRIDRQLMLDTNYRVGGILPDAISASITLPGSVSMSDQGFTRLTTLTHEAHHLMQQHQSGVFGFYLFRYIPTSFASGYHGHPDENFLRHFLTEYTAGI